MRFLRSFRRGEQLQLCRAIERVSHSDLHRREIVHDFCATLSDNRVVRLQRRGAWFPMLQIEEETNADARLRT
jgi:hypothetical protein